MIQAESAQALTRNQAVNLGLSTGKNIVKVNSFKIVDSAILQTFLNSSAICSSCKNAKGKLILWQDDSKRGGLKETLFSVCSNCNNKVYFDTSQIITSVKPTSRSECALHSSRIGHRQWFEHPPKHVWYIECTKTGDI